jgi:uncharacterized protein (TIGR03086 family)
MTDIAERYRKVAAGFTQRAQAVAADQWENPSPCEGWVARDVVRHLVDWIPGFLSVGPVAVPAGPSVDDDPVGAWRTLNDGLQGALDNPAVAAAEFVHPAAGQLTVERAIADFMLGDVLVHTWDLARATGQDDALDADESRRLLERMEQYEPAVRDSGHYGQRTEVPEDADVQTRLIAFTGRQP